MKNNGMIDTCENCGYAIQWCEGCKQWEHKESDSNPKDRAPCMMPTPKETGLRVLKINNAPCIGKTTELIITPFNKADVMKKMGWTTEEEFLKNTEPFIPHSSATTKSDEELINQFEKECMCEPAQDKENVLVEVLPRRMRQAARELIKAAKAEKDREDYELLQKMIKNRDYFADKMVEQAKKDTTSAIFGLEEDWTHSKTYKKVLKHRENCPSWKLFMQNKPPTPCIDCFGGGLTMFVTDLRKELMKKAS